MRTKDCVWPSDPMEMMGEGSGEEKTAPASGHY